MPPARAVFITSGRHGILLLYFGDSTGGRGAAFITVIIIVGSIVVENDGIVDDNGEFVNFHFIFLNFHLKNRFSMSTFDLAAGNLTLFLTETIDKRWVFGLNSTTNR